MHNTIIPTLKNASLLLCSRKISWVFNFVKNLKFKLLEIYGVNPTNNTSKSYSCNNMHNNIF